ncbi:MAG: glycosyltransferase [Chitinophagaceae bacterium]
MISILIPVFNWDVNELILDLSSQAKQLQPDVEIIVMDDGSQSSYRRLHHKLNDIAFVRYYEADKNNGRIRIRQMMAGLASFEWLLFLDCDSKIVSCQFLQNFYKRISDSVNVMAGGRIYSARKPADCRFRLHWKYGSIREKTRPGLEGHSNRFMTNNFLIRKNIFERFDFAGQWEGYGYEDTWMGIQLESMHIPIIYIDNPIKHEGLEESSVYLKKSQEALQNLKKLSSLVPQKILVKHVTLYAYFRRLLSLRLLWVIRLIYGMLRLSIMKNFHSCNPSLLLFDLYRLNYFASLYYQS